MKESLEELIKRIVNNLEVDSLDNRVESYRDYKSKYVNLKPYVGVQVELTSGKTVVIDVTDYFEEVVK